MSRRSQMSQIFVRMLAVGGLAGGLAGACVNLEDTLEGEPCTVAKDCWKTQECARTPQEEQLGLPGVCQDKGTGCVTGAQLGCACNPNDVSISCYTTTLPNAMAVMYPAMVCDPATLVCIVAPPEEETP